MTGIEAVFSSHTPVSVHQTMLALDCPISVKEPRRYVFQQRMGLAIADINEDYALDFLVVIRFQRMTPDLSALGVRQNVNELPAVPWVRPGQEERRVGKEWAVRVTYGGRR